LGSSKNLVHVSRMRRLFKIELKEC
jgi:hypothetical protein